ncbi:HAD family hydrolase [Limibacillus halophilus]|uniref:HAD superfamily hydrolase (TIGR01509 family) n=1 Tax=Limibacillus halophilus TaxID=1579333 RepID=A0A839SVW0_9PROT|nr:HAD family hydrolase [Limibacillus halophilus]MBB3066622.1 HAD superfamily hydrolase (TIGR01509 family) [Limibacillus halophilus]
MVHGVPSPGLLIFDCDGVLIDSETLACQAIADELAGWGLRYEGAEVAKRFAGYTDRQIADQVTQETRVSLPKDFPLRVQNRALEAFETSLKTPPGIHELLRSDQRPRCVASNSGRNRLRRALEIVDLLDFFGGRSLFSAEQVPQPKPAPDLHLLAAGMFGFAPENCLVIEDSGTGVQAARNAGMQVVGFLGATHLDRSERTAQAQHLSSLGAVAIFNDFTSLGDWLRQL